MKPHLKFWRGLWNCYDPRRGGYVGCGYTARQAYTDWYRGLFLGRTV